MTARRCCPASICKFWPGVSDRSNLRASPISYRAEICFVAEMPSPSFPYRCAEATLSLRQRDTRLTATRHLVALYGDTSAPQRDTSPRPGDTSRARVTLLQPTVTQRRFLPLDRVPPVPSCGRANRGGDSVNSVNPPPCRPVGTMLLASRFDWQDDRAQVGARTGETS